MSTYFRLYGGSYSCPRPRGFRVCLALSQVLDLEDNIFRKPRMASLRFAISAREKRQAAATAPPPQPQRKRPFNGHKAPGSRRSRHKVARAAQTPSTPLEQSAELPGQGDQQQQEEEVANMSMSASHKRVQIAT
jgi:hypothetical protein